MANFDNWISNCSVCGNDHTIPHEHGYCNTPYVDAKGRGYVCTTATGKNEKCYEHRKKAIVNFDPTDRGDTLPMPRPKDDEICSSCKHAFKLHYLAYNGMTTGCSFDIPSGGDQRDSWGGHKCECKGFQLTYKYR